MSINIGGNILSNIIAKEYEYRSVPTAGLLCHLDPNIFGTVSGNTLYDLSGNQNHGTLTNGPTYSSVNGGVIVLDGVNDYISVGLNMASSNYTVIGAARYVTVSYSRTFSGLNNNWLMGHWGNTTLNYYAEGWNTAVGNGPGDTNWRLYAATGDISGDTYVLYANNSQVVSSNGGTAGPNGFGIGRYNPGASEHSNSHIGVFLVYDRVLSTGELTDIYNLFKNRYGV